MWLYSYESARKGLSATKATQHVAADQYFGPLLANKVEFYRGDFHMHKNAYLTRLRVLRLRQLLQETAVAQDLAGDVTEFGDTDDNFDDEDVY